MTVVINELDVRPTAESGSRGSGGGDGDGGGRSSSSTLHAEMIRILRRDSSRRARLWAD